MTDMPEYIDRKALQEMLNAKAEMALGTPKKVFYAVAKMVELLPAADVAPVVHSEWDYGDEPLEVDENGNVQAFCKRCGAGDVHAKRNINKVPYCWSCSAKMDGRKE